MGETLWLRHDALDRVELAASVATTSDGQAVYTASMRGTRVSDKFVKGSDARFILRRYSVSGQLQWTREFGLTPNPYDSPDTVQGRVLLTVGPTGALYMLTDVRGGGLNSNGNTLPGVVLSKLSSDGGLLWHTVYTHDSLVSQQALALVASREDGVFLSVRDTYVYDRERQCSPTAGAVARYDANGALIWRKRVGEPQCGDDRADVLSLAAQPDGGVALGGAFTGYFLTPVGSANTPSEAPFLGTLTARGEWGWLQTFSQSQGRMTSIGSSAKGTVVGVGQLVGGSFTWGKDALGQAPAFLLVAEANGSPRWAQSLGRVEDPVIAVEPAGRVAVAGLSRDAPDSADAGRLLFFARRYNLAGKLLWTRFFKRSGGPGGDFAEEVVSAAPSGEGNGNTLLLGHFSHTEDFGTGARTPRDTDLFLLKLGAGPEF